jgi:hypothetical protein
MLAAFFEQKNSHVKRGCTVAPPSGLEPETL